MNKSRVFILGKLPPPYYGPAIATQILLNSGLSDKFDLIHFDTRINRSLSTMGEMSVGKLWRHIPMYWKMLRMAKRYRPDLVLIPISQTTMGFVKDSLFILIANRYSSRVLIQLRGSNFKNWLDNSGPLTRAYVRYVLKKTNGVIVLGNKLKYLFEQYFEDESIYVIPNGANFSIPESQPNVMPRILYLSTLIASKGIEDVLEALVILKKRQPGSFICVAAGEWWNDQLKTKCQRFIRENEIDIEIIPPVSGEKKLALLANSDIFVFPPREPEGHPWVIVEAMAAGLPIITTDQGAITESVEDGVNGFIVDSNRPDQLAEKLSYLLTDRQLRQQMGAAGRKRYFESFTEETMMEKYAKCFENVIHQTTE